LPPIQVAITKASFNSIPYSIEAASTQNYLTIKKPLLLAFKEQIYLSCPVWTKQWFEFLQPRLSICNHAGNKRGMKLSFIDNDASVQLQSQSVFHRYRIIHANALKGFRTHLAANAAISFALAFCDAESGGVEI
jgi:hypothetical protein